MSHHHQAARTAGADIGPARRTTRQRTAVAEALDSVTDFRSAQQLYELLRDRGERVGLATVYRTLQAMVDGGEVDAMRAADGETSYRRCRTTGHHHHLVCRDCGRTVEVEGPDVEAWAEAIATAHSFTDVEHTVEVFGTCARCVNRGRGAR